MEGKTAGIANLLGVVASVAAIVVGGYPAYAIDDWLHFAIFGIFFGYGMFSQKVGIPQIIGWLLIVISLLPWADFWFRTSWQFVRSLF